MSAVAGPSWEETIDRVVPGIVSLRVVGTRNFDTEGAGVSSGTGFVVDKERGILLTNRHMVHAGPVVTEAVFSNYEEVPLTAIYRDPVHDFGFYRFNPKDVRFLDVPELSLNPTGARVGMNIRVIGNDSGEKISILDGTLARLDRAAPRYGRSTYNDFNTFYLQAASNTSGGSSGSPVLNQNGEVVGLNAGGKTRAASSFYLPLDRVARALALIQRGEAVSRGTLQTVFLYKPYDELRRLGVTEEAEAKFRSQHPELIGGLVVEETVPGGPGWGTLQSGDVLLSMNGQTVQTFEPLERMLDDSVGAKVSVDVLRGGVRMSFDLTVDDLHALSPAEYVEFGQGVFHPVSYQQARNHSNTPKGIYVASSGYAFRRSGINKGSVITSLNGVEVHSSETFFRTLEAIPHGARVPVKFHPVQDAEQSRTGVLVADRLWYGLNWCKRDDVSGAWPCIKASPASPEPAQQQAASLKPTEGVEGVGRSWVDRLVMVEFDVPYPTSGLKDFNYKGAGLIIDGAKGYVLVDRDTVPVMLGEATLTFGGQVRLDAEVVYVHPTHNYAVLQYDAQAIQSVPLKPITFAKKPAKSGDVVWQIGLNSAHQIVQFKGSISRVKPLYLGKSRRPKFRDVNVEGIELADHLPSLGGVLVTKKGHLVATWSSFYDPKADERDFFGLPISFLSPVFKDLLSGHEISYYTLGAEMWPISLADGREMGLSEEWAERLFEADSSRRKVLRVVDTWGGAPVDGVLETGDLLVAINGEPVTRLTDIEALAGDADASLSYIRDGKEVNERVDMLALSGVGVNDVINWAGLVVHAPHHEVSAQTGRKMDGVYTAWMWYGSPASKFGIYATRRIVEMDGVPISDMDSFYEEILKQEHGQSVRIKLESLDKKIRVKTMKIDLNYWAPERLRWQEGGWKRVD